MEFFRRIGKDNLLSATLEAPVRRRPRMTGATFSDRLLHGLQRCRSIISVRAVNLESIGKLALIEEERVLNSDVFRSFSRLRKSEGHDAHAERGKSHQIKCQRFGIDRHLRASNGLEQGSRGGKIQIPFRHRRGNIPKQRLRADNRVIAIVAFRICFEDFQ